MGVEILSRARTERPTEALAYHDNGIRLRDLLAELRRKWLWIAICIGVFTAAFSADALLSTPIYRASVVMSPTDTERELGSSNLLLGQLGGLSSLAGLDLSGDASDSDEALAVLESRDFTEHFIDDNNLLPKLFPQEWDARLGRWKDGAASRVTPSKAFRMFDRRIRSVVKDRKTKLITLQIDWTDRRAAAAWANELVDRLNAEMRRRAITRANAYIDYLEGELKTVALVETRTAIDDLVEAQIKQRMVATVTPDFAFRIIDRAMVPDKDDAVSPKRAILLLLGPLVGTGIGVILIVLSIALRYPRPGEHSRGNEG